MRRSTTVFISGLLLLATRAQARLTAAAEPYKIVNTTKVGGAGGFDYVFADVEGRRLYVPRSGGTTSRVTVFDLDTLKSAGEIPNTVGVHGVAVDPKSNHGFTSSKPVVMFDTKTLETIKTIDVQGNPDGILFEPFKQQVYVLSHRATECDRAQCGRWFEGGHDRPGRSTRAGRQ